jgi:hypothetical protein
MKTRKETTQTMKHIKPQLTKGFDINSASLVSGGQNPKCWWQNIDGQFQIWQTRDGLYNVFAYSPNGEHFSQLRITDRFNAEKIALAHSHNMGSI